MTLANSTLLGQGWRERFAAGETKRLLEHVAPGPSVVSIAWNAAAGVKVDDAARIRVVTRIGEGQRTRTFPSRGQGLAIPVPAGLTTVTIEETTQPLEAWALVTHGVAVTETTAGAVYAPGGNADVTYATPAFARRVVVTILQGSARVFVGPGDYAVAAGTLLSPLTLPAYATTRILDLTGAGGAVYALAYEVTS